MNKKWIIVALVLAFPAMPICVLNVYAGNYVILFSAFFIIMFIGVATGLHQITCSKQQHTVEVYTLVKFDYESLDAEYYKYYLDKFPVNEVFVFIGELKQMPGHCVVCNYRTGKIISGYHTADFVPLTEDDGRIKIGYKGDSDVTDE